MLKLSLTNYNIILTDRRQKNQLKIVKKAKPTLNKSRMGKNCYEKEKYH